MWVEDFEQSEHVHSTSAAHIRDAEGDYVYDGAGSSMTSGEPSATLPDPAGKGSKGGGKGGKSGKGGKGKGRGRGDNRDDSIPDKPKKEKTEDQLARAVLCPKLLSLCVYYAFSCFNQLCLHIICVCVHI